MSFYKLGISHPLVHALEQQHIFDPTPIQSLAIPYILKGEDLLAEAQTGTGKTLAFLLPIFQRIDPNSQHLEALIVTPTRELAIQITSVAKSLLAERPLHVLAAYGGQDVHAQMHRLQGTVHLVIGTPGRILDHMRRGTLDTSHIRTLVVDEADQLFHIGFKEELKAILKALPKTRQTLCFSATLSQSVDGFRDKHLNQPKCVTAPKQQIVVEGIQEFVVETSNRKKLEDFMRLLAQDPPYKAIIFTRSRRGADSLHGELLEALPKNAFTKGAVEVLHGGLSQSKREWVMQQFRQDKIHLLVATDVAARGLDITGVTHVYNYNLPDDAENYVHRVGRTGRAGQAGTAYTLVTHKDVQRLKAIEAFIGKSIPRKQLP